MITLMHGASDAALTITSDFDFSDNTIPAAFGTIPYGTGPATGGGCLTFNGTTALRASTSDIYGGTPPANNYGYEVIITPSTLNSFDIIAAIVDGGGTNSGNFLFQQAGAYRLIECFEATSGGSIFPSTGTKVALAFVMEGGMASLYVNRAKDPSASLVFDASGMTPISTSTLEAVVLGGNLSDGATGAFNGTIDRARYFTFAPGAFNSTELLGPADGEISAVPEVGNSLWTILVLGSGAFMRRRPKFQQS